VDRGRKSLVDGLARAIVTIMRSAAIVFALALTLAAQPGDQSDVARAQRLLASPRWIDKAWGAYYAATLHSDKLNDSLIEAFQSAPLRAERGTEAYGFVAALFDSAIQSNLHLPTELLESFGETWTAPVVILLARDPQSEAALLRLRAKLRSDAEWMAVGNLLFERRSAEFLVETLRELHLSHVLTLTDGDPDAGVGGGWGAGCGDGFAVMPQGFPPIGLYVITTGQVNNVLLAPGPEKAYYHRFVVPTGKQTGFGGCGGSGREFLQVEYLAALNHLNVLETDNLFHRRTGIAARPGTNVQTECDAALNAQEAAIRDFVRQAQKNGMGSVTGVVLRIEPSLVDRRSNPRNAQAMPTRVFTLE
jgi:hypothetical protein